MTNLRAEIEIPEWISFEGICACIVHDEICLEFSQSGLEICSNDPGQPFVNGVETNVTEETREKFSLDVSRIGGSRVDWNSSRDCHHSIFVLRVDSIIEDVHNEDSLVIQEITLVSVALRKR